MKSLAAHQWSLRCTICPHRRAAAAAAAASEHAHHHRSPWWWPSHHHHHKHHYGHHSVQYLPWRHNTGGFFGVRIFWAAIGFGVALWVCRERDKWKTEKWKHMHVHGCLNRRNGGATSDKWDGHIDETLEPTAGAGVAIPADEESMIPATDVQHLASAVDTLRFKLETMRQLRALRRQSSSSTSPPPSSSPSSVADPHHTGDNRTPS